jgi:hypothetical protein
MSVDIDDSPGQMRLVLNDANLGIIGYPSQGGLHNIATRVGFPLDFVEKLSLRTQAMVINERLAAADELVMSFVREPFRRHDGEWSEMRLVTNIAPGWRGVVPHADVCQMAWDTMADVYGPNRLEINLCKRHDSGMRLRILSPEDAEVADGGRQVGDILRLGFECVHQYGFELTCRLFVVRLVCLNGMTCDDVKFEWKAGLLGTAQQQLEFVIVGVANAVGSFEELLDRCRTMAGTPLTGNMEQVLLERSRAMGLPQRLNSELLAAWRQEPVASEWGALNAFTRMATHSARVTDEQSRRIQAASGRWARGFDMVTARLPRPMADAVGAHIIEQINS